MSTKKQRAWEALSQIDSSAVTMQSVAAALQGEFVDVWDTSSWQQQAFKMVSFAGKKAAITAVERVIANSGADPALAERITTHALASWAVSLYRNVAGPFDAIIIGTPGGGVAHLATALGAPFLSQNFVATYKAPQPPDDVQTYLARGTQLAAATLRRNRALAIVNHYDPLHKRLMMKHLNLIRYKLLNLPEAYKAFIFQTLRPGGTIIFTDCRYPWPMYFMGERHWFQVGGLGAVRPWDFIAGQHSEIAALQQAAGVEPVGNWGLKDRTAFEMPESEWGALPPLHQQVAQFARENAYEFVALESSHPEHFSYLAFRVWRKLLRRAKIEPQGVFLETFTQIAPAATRAAALLPVWIPRNCEASLDFLQRVQRDFRLNLDLRDKPVFWLPLPNFDEPFDMVSWDAWFDVLKGLDVRPLGMRPHLYPADPVAFYATRQELLDWIAQHPQPVTARATLDIILQEARILRRQPFESYNVDRH